MNLKKISIIFVVLGIFVLFMVFNNYKKNRTTNPSAPLPSNTIPQSDYGFFGQVTKIEGKTFFIKDIQAVTFFHPTPKISAPADNTQGSEIPTPKTGTLVYGVVITDKTPLYSTHYVNYMFKTVTPVSGQKMKIRDIKVGHYLYVESPVDPRGLENAAFEALKITIPLTTTVLNGTIVSLDGNTIILKAKDAPLSFAPLIRENVPALALGGKEYRITITSDTEISRMAFNPATTNPQETPIPPKPEKLSISDLKKDMQVTIYTNTDVTTKTELTALRIDPMIPIPTPSAKAN